ncbi:MAG: hypothetical protein IPH62_03170 [Ignavibacteriae bacterium]|nr:hypothetical protein [Ignavibacteriota bacterium]
MKSKLLTIILLSSILTYASEHGIYLLTNKSVSGSISEIQKTIVDNAAKNGFKVLNSIPIHTPDYIKKDSKDLCGFKAHLIILTSQEYLNTLTSYGSKYLIAGFLRVGIYETPQGTNVIITDPETINRIVFNDLYENDKQNLYNEVIAKTKILKVKLVGFLHNSVAGEKVQKNMEPIRDNDDLAESSKDMFMMVGPLTLFNDEDQFPKIYSEENKNGLEGLKNLKSEFVKNLETFQPSEDDKNYRYYKNEDDLKWKIVSEIESPKKDAILLGITRPQTESVSFNISGSAREKKGDLCPGIDHLTAYPIEILLIQEGNNLNVYTQKEMHRMDMYFWDAGMSAFMNHMSMPAILDESIKKALLGKKFIEE